jgi:sodium-dependent dicarboxylate transporter 2/3/5
MAVLKENNNGSWHRRAIMLLVAVVLYVVLVRLPLPIDQVQQNVLAVMLVAALLWFSEALPLFVTSLLIPVLLAFSTPIATENLFYPFFDPVVALFFGSFVLAIALSKYGLDEKAMAFVFRLFGTSPRKLLLGLMIAVAFVGMWLSNTATVALLLPAFLLIIRKNSLATRAPNFMKALLLGLAIATSIDGIATIIGTPPNAIAVKFLADAGISVSFFDWLTFGIPAMLILLPLSWFVLTLVFPPEIKQLKPVTLTSKKWTRQQWLTLAVILLVIALWVTQPLHSINSAVVALIGVGVLYALNLLKIADLSKVSFSTLILFGGGLVLGEAMESTGVTDTIATQFVSLVGQQSEPVLLLALMGFAVVLTAFASNTAIAALIIPVVISIARSSGAEIAPLVIGTTLALSIDVISPVGTPPSAMVYGTGKLRVADFLRSGVLITVIGVIIIYAVISLVL